MAGQAISLVAATWLLVLRVLALYSGNKLVAITLYFVFLSTHITTIVLSALILKEIWSGLSYLAFPGICAAYPSRMLGVVYFAPVVCEIVLVAMQLFHAYRHTFHAMRFKTLLRPTTPLLRTLYADGFAYFVVVVGLRLWSAFIFIFADVSYWYLSTYLEFALISTSVSRLVLHLRGTAESHRQTLQMTTSIPLSQLAQSTTNITSANATNPHGAIYSPNRHSRFLVKQNRNSHQPNRNSQYQNHNQHQNHNRNQNHDHHKKKQRRNDNHTSSSFQNAAETIYSYASDIPQVHFSSSPSSEHLRRVEGNRSLATILDVGEGYEYGERGTEREREPPHRCDLCCDDFEGYGVVRASRRVDDDHSYVELFPASPISRDSVRPPPPPPLPPPLPPPPPPPGMGVVDADVDVEGGGYGYGYGYGEGHGVRVRGEDC